MHVRAGVETRIMICPACRGTGVVAAAETDVSAIAPSQLLLPPLSRSYRMVCRSCNGTGAFPKPIPKGIVQHVARVKAAIQAQIDELDCLLPRSDPLHVTLSFNELELKSLVECFAFLQTLVKEANGSDERTEDQEQPGVR